MFLHLIPRFKSIHSHSLMLLAILSLAACQSESKEPMFRHLTEGEGRPFLIRTDTDFLIDGVPSSLEVELEMFLGLRIMKGKYLTDTDAYASQARRLLQEILEEDLPQRLKHSNQGMPILRRDKVLELLWEKKDEVAEKITPPSEEKLRLVVIDIRGT